MKNVKSLTCLFIVLLVSACNGHSSAAFSSSDYSLSSSETSSSASLSSDSSLSSSSSSSISSSSSSSTSSKFEDDTVYYDGYYASLVSWQNGEDLKNQLYTIIRNGYTPLSYTHTNQNYSTNINADHSQYDFEYLNAIYSEENIFKSDTNKGWQREHAWCASLMCGTQTGQATKFKGRATDFHNLFAASASGNQARGNKNYGTANVNDFYYKSNTTNNGYDGYSSDEFIFEPGDIDKGRLARAIFYMATMYKNDELDTVNNINMKGLRIVEERVKYPFEGDVDFAIGNLSTLLQWNSSYQVDYLEMQHNIAVYSSADNLDKVAQGNRNPFVDYPELVDYVYGSKKDMPGSLKYVRAAATYLNCEDSATSHYAIKEAKREHDIGETISEDDYKVVAVKDNYTYEAVTTGLTHSLTGHTFDANDGKSLEASITTPLNTLSYDILINPMGACSNKMTLSSSGISSAIHNQEQEVTYNECPFLLQYNTTIQDSATFYIRNIGTGGVTLGSENSPLTGFILKTKGEYAVDTVYIKACASNTGSQFYLTIKVGDTVIWEDETVSYLKNGFHCFGGALSKPLTGQITFIFTGYNALKINSVAFNQIIA